MACSPHDFVVGSSGCICNKCALFIPAPNATPQAGGGGGITKDETKEIVKEAYREVLEEQKGQELTFSEYSEGALRNYLVRLHVGFELGDNSVLPATALEFQPFVWGICGENEDTLRASTHLVAQLERFGVEFGAGHYELYDVHDKKDLLKVEDKKTGKLNGETDLILGPHGLHVLGLVQQSCVAVELKTQASVIANNGFGSFTAQATLELIACNYFSNQMTVVLLTDLCSGASIFTLRRNENESMSVIIYENLAVSQAAQFIVNHLIEDCVPIKNYVLEQGEKSADVALRAFKKSRVSALEDSVEWEQFQEMLQDCPPCTSERAEIINQLYRSCGFPQPAYLNMFI